MNSLKYYCDKHNYKFTVYRDKIIKDLHINFSKNAIVLDACKKYKEDYFVCIDTDVAVKDLNFKLESLITPGHILFAPKDFWAGEKKD